MMKRLMFFVVAAMWIGIVQGQDTSIFDLAVVKKDYRQTLSVYLKNDSATPLDIDTQSIYINGKKISEKDSSLATVAKWYEVSAEKGKGALWYDVYPNPVLPGKWARLNIRFFRKDEIGDKIDIKLSTNQKKSFEGKLTAVFDGGSKFVSCNFSESLDKIYIYIECGSDPIKNIFINGMDFGPKSIIKKVVATDGRIYCMIETDIKGLFAAGDYLVIKVEGGKYANAAFVKVMDPFFPIGIFGVEDTFGVYGPENGSIKEEYLKDCKEHLINCIHADYVRVRSGKNLDVLKKYDMKALFDPEWEPGKLLSTINEYRNDPVVLGWYIADEPEMHGNATSPMNMLKGRIPVFRKEGGRFASVFAHCPWTDIFYDYAGLVDVPLLDDYPVCARPLDNVSKTMTEGLNAYAPAPIWFVLQAYAGPIFGGRYPAPEELEFMTYKVIGMGAKGIFYFNYGHVPEPCYGVGLPMENLDRLYEKGSKKLQKDLESLKVDARNLWAMIKIINSNLNIISPLVLNSAPIPVGRASNESVKVLTLINPRSIIVIPINQNYDYGKKSTAFHAEKNLSVTVELPDWFTASGVSEVSDGSMKVYKYKKDGKTLSLDIPVLNVGQIFVINSK